MSVWVPGAGRGLDRVPGSEARRVASSAAISRTFTGNEMGPRQFELPPNIAVVDSAVVIDGRDPLPSRRSRTAAPMAAETARRPWGERNSARRPAAGARAGIGRGRRRDIVACLVAGLSCANSPPCWASPQELGARGAGAPAAGRP